MIQKKYDYDFYARSHFVELFGIKESKVAFFYITTSILVSLLCKMTFVHTTDSKKTLKISEGVNRRTKTTMVKRKRTEGQTILYKALHRKRKIEQREPHYKLW